MITGKQKSQFLLMILEDKAQDILALIDPTLSTFLIANMDNQEQFNAENIAIFTNELISQLNSKNIDWDSISLPDSATIPNQNETNFDFNSELRDDESEIPVDQSEADLEDTPSKDQAEEVSHTQDGFRTIQQAAELLIKESSQSIAFFLSRLDDQSRVDILQYIPEDIIENIKQTHIETIPQSDIVFQHMYDSLFIISDEEN